MDGGSEVREREREGERGAKRRVPSVFAFAGFVFPFLPSRQRELRSYSLLFDLMFFNVPDKVAGLDWMFVTALSLSSFSGFCGGVGVEVFFPGAAAASFFADEKCKFENRNGLESLSPFFASKTHQEAHDSFDLGLSIAEREQRAPFESARLKMTTTTTKHRLTLQPSPRRLACTSEKGWKKKRRERKKNCNFFALFFFGNVGENKENADYTQRMKNKEVTSPDERLVSEGGRGGGRIERKERGGGRQRREKEAEKTFSSSSSSLLVHAALPLFSTSPPTTHPLPLSLSPRNQYISSYAASPSSRGTAPTARRRPLSRP